MPNQPTHHAYWVKDIEGSDKSKWVKIGAAWPHQDGKGFNIDLELIPTQGGSTLISLREASDKAGDQDQSDQP